MTTTQSSCNVVGPQSASKEAVLIRAFLRATDRLGLNGRQAAQIIGTSQATISRMKKDGLPLVKNHKSFELAVLFVRVFRSLDSIVGGDEEKAKLWFHAENQHLLGTPVELVKSVEGLANVIRYLDAMRGRI